MFPVAGLSSGVLFHQTSKYLNQDMCSKYRFGRGILTTLIIIQPLVIVRLVTFLNFIRYKFSASLGV